LSVKTHLDQDVRPKGRFRLSPYQMIRGFLSLRWVEALRQRLRSLGDPNIRIQFSPSLDHHLPVGDDPLTVLSANLWHDWPRHRQLPERLESLAQLIEGQDAQVVLLQEALKTPGCSAADWLADRLDMAHGYVRANGDQESIGFEEGPAVLSKLPMLEMRALRMHSSAGPLVRRMALGARLGLGCCDLWVVSTHLGLLRLDQKRQLGQLHDWITELAGESTSVIGGDFNAGEHSQVIRNLSATWQDTYRQKNPEGRDSTHALTLPGGAVLRRQRLDYIFLNASDSNWGIAEAHHLLTAPIAHSDHKAVLARFHHSQLACALPHS
jgi:endonuclease/exonuclease/phosphatase family metal-dependent hydrolase